MHGQKNIVLTKIKTYTFKLLT